MRIPDRRCLRISGSSPSRSKVSSSTSRRSPVTGITSLQKFTAPHLDFNLVPGSSSHAATNDSAGEFLVRTARSPLASAAPKDAGCKRCGFHSRFSSASDSIWIKNSQLRPAPTSMVKAQIKCRPILNPKVTVTNQADPVWTLHERHLVR